MAGKHVHRRVRSRRERVSARYRRLRDELDLPARMSGDELEPILARDLADPDECDEYEPLRPGFDDRSQLLALTTSLSLGLERAYVTIERCLHATRPFNPLPGLLEHALPDAREPRHPRRAPLPNIDTELIEHLCTVDEQQIEAQLRERGGAEELSTIARLCEHGTLSCEQATALILFRPFWLRSVLDWRPGTALELVEYLLVAYPYPRFLLNAWRGNVDLRWVTWMIACSQGGSLRRLSRVASTQACPGRWPLLPKKLPEALFEVPAHYSPMLGLMYAEVRRLGGGEVELRRLRLHRSYVCDPTVARKCEREFWQATVRWLTRYREQLQDDQCARILGWARRMQIEQTLDGDAFDWAGRTPAAATRAELLRRASLRHGVRRWRALGLAWWDEIDGQLWEIDELLDSEALVRESARMHHCVQTYARACSVRRCAILNLSRNGAPVLTVELTLPDRRLGQVRGHCNRAASSTELQVLDRWQRATLAMQIRSG